MIRVFEKNVKSLSLASQVLSKIGILIQCSFHHQHYSYYSCSSRSSVPNLMSSFWYNVKQTVWSTSCTKTNYRYKIKISGRQQSHIMQEDAQALLLDISLSSNKKVLALLYYCTRNSNLTLL